jgi:dihydrofolate reductase/thymidylate synthase
MSRTFSVIAALDQEGGIGKRGALPWHLPADMHHFREVTTHRSSSSNRNAVIMGRHTWDSIPHKFRPLSERINIVITRQHTLAVPDTVVLANSFEGALHLLELSPLDSTAENIFVIGGAQIYTQALNSRQCRTLHLTRIEARFDCDVFFPTIPSDFTLRDCSTKQQHAELSYSFETYERASSS